LRLGQKVYGTQSGVSIRVQKMVACFSTFLYFRKYGSVPGAIYPCAGPSILHIAAEVSLTPPNYA
jgi:hypothetical protein